MAKKQCKDKIYGLNIIMKKSRTMEEELNEKRDILLKIQMQHKMTVVYLILIIFLVMPTRIIYFR